MSNKRLSAVISIGGAVSSSLKSAIGSAKSSFNEIGAAVASVTARQAELNRMIQQTGRNGAAGSQLRIGYAQQELAALDKQLVKLRQAQQLEQKRTENAKQRGELQGKLLGATITTGVMAAPVIGSTKRAAEFQYQLRLIGNTANMSADEVLRLGQVITAISQRTAQGATTVQKAMGFLIAAGLDAKTAEGMLENIAKTATATGGDIEDIAKAAFTLNDSLKIKPGKDMENAIDSLALAGKEGNVELKDMAKVLPVLGSGFTALKMQGREAAATMGAALEVARKGAADADEAANNMKNYIAKIMSPETLKKAKKEFNLDLYKIITDAQKSGKNPFEESMKAIMKATKGDQKAIGELFSDMQVQNFIRPMIQNWDKYLEIKNKALNADGVISKDFDINMKEAKVAMDRSAQAVERLGIALGVALLPALTQVLNVFTPLVQTAAEFATNNPTLTATIVGVAVGLSVLRVGMIATRLVAVLFSGSMLALTPIMTGLGVALRFVGTSILWIGRALLLNPIGLAVTAIAGAAFLIYKYWEPIKGFFSGLWSSITDTFNQALQWIVEKIDFVGAKWREFTGWLGIGASSGQAKQSSGANAAGLPAAPAMASRNGGGTTTVSNQNQFHITQLPGENADDLANRVIRKMNNQNAVRGRSMMYDPVTP